MAYNQDGSFSLNLTERVAELDFNRGTPVTPYALSSRYMDLVRQTGRTSALFTALPSTGEFVILCANFSHITMLKDALRRFRPDIDPKKAHFFHMTAQSLDSKLAGLGLPVYVDHLVFELQSLEMTKFYNQWDRKK